MDWNKGINHMFLQRDRIETFLFRLIFPCYGCCNYKTTVRRMLCKIIFLPVSSVFFLSCFLVVLLILSKAINPCLQSIILVSHSWFGYSTECKSMTTYILRGEIHYICSRFVHDFLLFHISIVKRLCNVIY